jgi:hypothetical protein
VSHQPPVYALGISPPATNLGPHSGMPMRSILQIGNDSALLATRASVLELTGAIIMTALGNEATNLLCCVRFDLIVFCHTIPEAMREEISLAARAWYPNVYILKVLTSAFSNIAPDETVPDPARLLTKVADVLDNVCPKQQTIH